jgi:cholesterol 7-dehydrogenase
MTKFWFQFQSLRTIELGVLAPRLAIDDSTHPRARLPRRARIEAQPTAAASSPHTPFPLVFVRRSISKFLSCRRVAHLSFSPTALAANAVISTNNMVSSNFEHVGVIARRMSAVGSVPAFRDDWWGYLAWPMPAVSTIAVAVAVVLAAVAWKLVLSRPFEKHRLQNPERRRGQRPGDYPPPFPNGWFSVWASHDINKGDVRSVTAFGQQLVVFREYSGKVAVLDAYCPHLGAHLGEGGSVTARNCLRCPFHGWEFDAEGTCRFVNGTDVIPPNSNTRSWPCVEANGVILVWHHAAGVAPTWDVERYPYIDDGSYYRSGQTTSYVNTHIREIPENGADSAHLNVLHTDFVIAQLRPVGLAHGWNAAWRPHDTIEHKSCIALSQHFELCGYRVPGTTVTTEINQIGPGMVSLQLFTPLGRVHVFEYVTPIRALEQRILHVAFCNPYIPQPIASFILWSLDAQFHRDQPVWENKRMATRPVISKADGPILEFRRWFQRFYSTESISFADAVARQNMLDW